MATALECLAAYRQCLSRCDLEETTGERQLCRVACCVSYASCLSGHVIGEVGEEILETAEDAGNFLRAHPEVAVGTLLVIGGVTMIAVLGPSALLVAVAV